MSGTWALRSGLLGLDYGLPLGPIEVDDGKKKIKEGTGSLKNFRIWASRAETVRKLYPLEIVAAVWAARGLYFASYVSDFQNVPIISNLLSLLIA